MTAKDKYAVLQNLLLLELDVLKSYRDAADRLADPDAKKMLSRYENDCLNHTRNLRAVLENQEEIAPLHPDAREVAFRAKVIIADLLGGDGDILRAMFDNATVLCDAYRACQDIEGLDAASIQTLNANYEDVKRHRYGIGRCKALNTPTAA